MSNSEKMVIWRLKMSGECEKCGSHTLECLCKHSLLLTFGNRKKAYVQVFPDTKEIWVDMDMYPISMLLCALVDGIGIMTTKIKDKDHQFVNSEWVINEWGGPKEFIEHTIKGIERIERNMSDILSRKEKNFVIES